MPDFSPEFWMVYDSFEKLLYVMVGAVIGFASSHQMWKLNATQQAKQRKVENYRRLIHLALACGTYIRALIYAKKEGVTAVAKLGGNPSDEMMAFTMFHGAHIGAEVQKMHLLFDLVYQQPMDDPQADKILLKIRDEVEGTMNAIITQTIAKGNAEKLDPDPLDAEAKRKAEEVAANFQKFAEKLRHPE